MLGRWLRNLVLALTVGGIGFLCSSTRVPAVPSFARQTGMDCISCHTVWPELTPFGRHFKLTGYTMSKSDKIYQFPPPLAAMFQGSFTHTGKPLPPGTPPFESRNQDNVNLPQEASIYYAGKILGKLGAFAQFTFDGVSSAFLVDMTDIRFADTVKLGGKPLIYGISFNNNPTLQDVWNTGPAWGFPFASSSLAPTPAAGAVINGTLASQVGGLGIYAYWNNLIYGEVNFYRTAANGYPQFLSAGTHVDNLVDGVAPYWRVFLQHQQGKHSFMAGHYGMVTHIFPPGQTRGNSDRFTDLAFDAQYQYISKKHLFSVATTWIHEIQDWNASFALGNTFNRSDNLDTFKVNLNYYYRSRYGTFGGNFAFFNLSGSKDVLLYTPDPLDGSRYGRPTSNGFIIQGVYVPPVWDRAKIVVQYTIYDMFNGASSNYDGNRRNASDNNTLYLLVWLML